MLEKLTEPRNQYTIESKYVHIYVYIENDPYCAFLSTPTCDAWPAIQSAIQNVTTYTAGRRGQKGAVGIIFDIAYMLVEKTSQFF